MHFLSKAIRALVAVLMAFSAFTLQSETWIQTSAPITNWSGLTCSADGTKLAATVPNGPIYVSTNSGLSWIQTGAPIESWESIASSADGRVLAALTVHWGYAVTGAVYISTNTGVTWTRSTIPEDAEGVAVSADGSKIAGCWSSDYPTQPGRLYLSADAGASWHSQPADYRITCLAVSGMTFAVSGSSIAISTNFGDTWHPASGGRFSLLALSWDASTMLGAASVAGWGCVLSTNAGLTWTNLLVGDNYSPAVSADGRKLVVAASFPYDSEYPPDHRLALYTSSDAGRTWVEGPRGPTNTFMLSASADVNRIAVAGHGTGIYILQTTPTPRLEITPSATAVKLSWVVPSQPFTLQQSPSPAVGAWQDVAQQPTFNYSNLRHELTLQPGAGPMFYRLVSR